MAELPIVMTSAGLQPQSLTSLLNQLLANVSAQVPGYTANLPGSLIEDVSSTSVQAIALCDSARVELVNSVTPYGANEFLLIQLGNIYGVDLGEATNTSVFCIFSSTTQGFVVPIGFTVTDGVYQYVVQDGGIVGSSGSTLPLFCVATVPGTWAVPANSVTSLVSSVPSINGSPVVLTVTNPESGTPGAEQESFTDFRARVLQAGLAASQGMARYMKTLINAVPGVQPRLVSVVQRSSTGFEVIVGGGDPYQVAYAIWQALFDTTRLVPSQTLVQSFTNANPGVVTTSINHGLVTGQIATITGASPNVWNASYTITVITENSFSVGVNTTLYAPYVSGGVVTPNSRNQTITINDYPDSYPIPFVVPPQQTVTISLLWNTSSLNFVSGTAVAQLGAAALVDYINSITVGQPMNYFELQATFQAAVANLIPTPLLTRMVFTVSIDGVVTAPQAGTGIIQGDSESFLFATTANITIAQG